MARRAVSLLLLASVPALANAAALAEEPPASLLDRGRALAAAKDLSGAYVAFAGALRAATEQDHKDAARDELLRLATPPPEPLTDAERGIVVARIDEERARYLRDVANRLLDRKHLRGALRLLSIVKGSLAEEATAKVIGDPKGAERREREVADLRVRIFGDLPPAERKEADAVADAGRGDAPRLLREGDRLRREGKPLGARRVFQEVVLNPAAPEEARARAREQVAALEAAILQDLHADERKAIDEALAQPAFARLTAVASREFVFIGDRDLVARIPERSRFVLDLAYVAITDLAGRVPNPGGDRVTVFFKELWDFAGGIGGGSRIDIGRADPRGKAAVLVSTGLYFHELSHCVFDVDPGFAGWVEGIANFGAAFAAEFLRQETDAWPAATANLDAFRRDFLWREEAYWRMAPYGPSAGWFLHWIDAYGRRPGKGHDWVRYGRLFRAWNSMEPEPWTVPGIARAFGALLVREFGPAAWKDLEAHGFPVEGGPEAAAIDATARPGPGGEVTGWRVCGPFYPPERGDGFACVFPPEREARFAREYASPQQVARWHRGGTDGPVAEDPAGLVEARWAYPEGSVTYGLVDVEVPAATDAWAHVSTAHRWALWVDDRVIERQEWESGRLAYDRDRVPLHLAAGRHRLLFKTALGWLGPSFALRLTDRAGRPIPGMRCLDPEERAFEPSPPAKWKSVFRDDFARAGAGAWLAGPGGLSFRNKAMRGTDSTGAVPWRKYSVRPGFPQDSPSNQATLDPKVVARTSADVRVEAAFALNNAGHPKVALTLDAEDADGGLTGWTVIVVPEAGGVDVRLERYDRLWALAPGLAVPAAKEHLLAIERRDGFVTVVIDGVYALERISAPALKRRGLRLCTWGPEPAVTRFEALRPD